MVDPWINITFFNLPLLPGLKNIVLLSILSSVSHQVRVQSWDRVRTKCVTRAQSVTRVRARCVTRVSLSLDSGPGFSGLSQKTKDPLSMCSWSHSVFCPSRLGPGQACLMRTEEAALPLPELALSLFISSGLGGQRSSCQLTSQPPILWPRVGTPQDVSWLAPSPHCLLGHPPPVKPTAFLVPAVL